MIELSSERSRETMSRARPIAGGKTTCSHCGEPQAAGSYYCRTHKREYDRQWRASREAEFKRLRALAASIEGDKK